MGRLDNHHVPLGFVTADFMGYKKKKDLGKETTPVWRLYAPARALFWRVQWGERAEVLRGVNVDRCP